MSRGSLRLPFILVGLSLFALAHAHIRWVCPRPEDPNTGLKSGPCSPDHASKFDREYMDITPGPMTVRFEESIVHAGAPTIIWLHNLDKNESCLLLDHIPHNDAGEMDLQSCPIFDYPIGRCPSQNYVTVKIPDIECERCYIQAISVMLDKYPEGEVCKQIDSGNNNCSTYYTCANVKIRPTSRGVGKSTDTCTNYNNNLLGTWPYMYPNGIYFDLGMDFSKQGWLQGSTFIGANAPYWRGVDATGPCAPETRTFGGTLKNGMDSKGTVSFSVTEDRMRLSGSMGGLGGTVSKIAMSSSAQDGAPEFTVPLAIVKTNKMEAILNMSSQVKYIEESADKFLNKLTISQSNGETTMDIEEVMSASIHDVISWEYYGQAVFKLLRDNSLHISVTVSNVASFTGASLNGPARPGLEGPVLLDLTSSMKSIGDGVMHGEYTLNLHRHPLVADVMMHLWNELIYIKVSTTDANKDIRGQVSRPGTWHCPSPTVENPNVKEVPNTCYWFTVTSDGGRINIESEVVDTNGYASMYVDPVVPGRVHYRILLQNVAPNETVTTVGIYHYQVEEVKVNAMFNRNDPVAKDHVLYAKGYVNATAEIAGWLRDGDLKLSIMTSRSTTELSGDIPKMERNKCTRPTQVNVNWQSGNSDLPVTALQGDEMVFTYSGTDTVELLSSVDSYNNCNFAGATVIAEQGQSPITYKMSATGTFYLSSKTGCASGLKTDVTVYDPIPSGDLLSEGECARSVYSYLNDMNPVTTKIPPPIGTTTNGAIHVASTISAVIMSVIVAYHM
ncbi:unnamed protein product [Owenia fusiformis]|uniref:CHRD domain-containing protein n=1 Tax=Owenia fusiformis TaxID=6347 RepID=A0A8J1TRM1_OWEFU|nr:unnamed protein product [Owenia fusiformis]